MLNGSFGVGKSTVAKLLRRELARSRIYDPEWAGLVLLRLPRWVGLRGGGTNDFQDIRIWRRCTIAGIRVARAIARGPVIVPMAFTNPEYWDEVINGIGLYDDDIRTFCLKADLPAIRRRLVERGDNLDPSGSGWLNRRIIECETAHRDPRFGEPVDTNDMSADETAKYVAGLV